MTAWPDLADRLRSRYPDDWADRYASYKDGSNPDLQKWRALGSETYAPQRVVRSDPWHTGRNERIRHAARSGVPLALLAERFSISASAVSEILCRFGERAAR